MILVLKDDVTRSAVDAMLTSLAWKQIHALPSVEGGRFLMTILNREDAQLDLSWLSVLPEVAQVLPVPQKFELTSRAAQAQRSIITVGGHPIGGPTLTVMAGPCSIESEAQIYETAAHVAAAGAQILRGGAFKPRTSPYEFQGLGEIGLQYLQSAAKHHGLMTVSEVMDGQDIEMVAAYVDILQIGARNMQNFALLKQIGKTMKPVLLKRGLSATYREWLMAAEYILNQGNPNVILCERGIRTFEPYTRNTLDIAAVPILKELTHLPVMVDPSHGTGLRSIVPHMAYAALSAGADGLMIEVHPRPDAALSDAKQTITPQTFHDMMHRLRQIAAIIRSEV